MPAKDSARDAALAAIKRARPEITAVCRSIYQHPEPAFEERRASDVLCGLLETHGFAIERGVAGLETAFRAVKRNHDEVAMRRGLRHGHVALIAEYDAIPGLGHATGNNLTAGAAVAVAIGLAAALEHERGTVEVLGCPASELNAGKVPMVAAGLFDEPDAILGAHPATTGEGFCDTIENTGETFAERTLTIRFTPSEGNAGEDSGELSLRFKAALESLILPENMRLASLAGDTLVLRADDSAGLDDLTDRIVALANDIASAAGADADVDASDVCREMITSRVLARRVKTWADTLKIGLDKIHKMPRAGVTDWGNVSFARPAFDARFPISAEPIVSGTREFGFAANSIEAYDRLFRLVDCVCLVGLDVLRDMYFRSILDDQLVKALATKGIQRPHRRWLGVRKYVPTPEDRAKKGPKLTDFKILGGPGESLN